MSLSGGKILNQLFMELYTEYEPVIQEVKKELSVIFDEDRDIIKEAALFASKLIEYGHIPPTNEFYRSFFFTNMFTRIYNENIDRCYIHNVLFTIYNSEDNIKKLIRNWKFCPLLSRRIHILEEALEQHIQGKYYSSTALLSTQVEGIIFDAINFKGKTTFQFAKQIKKIFGNNTNYLYGQNSDMNKILRDYILNNFLSEFEYGKPVKYSVSRHSIAHGYNVEYGTLINSIEMIRLIDYLQENLFYIYREDEQEYHVSTCNVVKNWDSDVQKVFYNVNSEEYINKKACYICRPELSTSYITSKTDQYYHYPQCTVLNSIPKEDFIPYSDVDSKKNV